MRATQLNTIMKGIPGAKAKPTNIIIITFA